MRPGDRLRAVPTAGSRHRCRRARIPSRPAAGHFVSLGSAATCGTLPGRADEPVPAPPWIRPSFLTSIWISSSGRDSLIALRGLQAEPADLAQADPGQDPRHGSSAPYPGSRRLSATAAAPRSPRPDSHRSGWRRRRRGGAVQQTRASLGAVAGDPLRAGWSLIPADQRPPRILLTIDQQLAAFSD